MKNGLKIILALTVVYFIAPAICTYAGEENKTAFTITTEEKFTLTFIDTSSVLLKVRIWLKYESKEDKYTIAVYKQEPNERLDSFNLNGDKLYNGIKEKLNSIAQKQGIEKAVTEASGSDVYLWVLAVNPANMVDRNTLSGKLALSQYIMVLKKGYDKNYDNYPIRSSTVQIAANNYSAAQAKVAATALDQAKTKEKLIATLNTEKTMIITTHQQAGNNNKAISEQADTKNKEIRRLENSATELRADLDDAEQRQKDSADSINNVRQQPHNSSEDSAKKESEIARLMRDTTILSIKINYSRAELQKVREKIENLTKDIDALNKQLVDTTGYNLAIDMLKYNLNSIQSDSMTSLANYVKAKITNEDTVLIANLISQNNALLEMRKKAGAEIQKWNQQSIYEIDKISLQFERGFLERIQVWVTVDDKQEIFENVYAIGFSSVSNFKDFKYIKLFARNSDIAFPFIYLGDVFSNYDNYLHNYTRDYCPADTAINEVDPADKKILNLSTERLINVFDSKIYTDLRGIAENQPNGLVQIDVNKRFNLNTHRRQVYTSRNNFGYFNYIILWGALTKIEKEDRVLQLRNDRVVVNNTLVSPSYATNLDFRQYEMLSFGGDLNLLLFDRPDTKFTFYFDVGARYGLTKVRDSVLKIEQGAAIVDANRFKEYDAGTLTFFPRISAEVLSQQRVGFTVSYQYNYTYMLSNNLFKQVASYAKSQTSITLLDTRARGSHMLELYMRIQTSENDRNKFFLRARLFMQNGDMNTSFSQLQLGYSYNLFYKK